MRKSGLHKQISSIFDGVPVPANNTLTEDSDLSVELTEPTTEHAAEQGSLPATTPPPKPAGPSLAQRMSASPLDSDSMEREPIPVLQVGRPMPLSKSKVMSGFKLKPGLSVQIKKAIFRSNASLDPRQKKAGVLVGILSLVFGVVLFVSLGGVGQSQATAADATGGDQAALVQTTQKTAEEWKRPESMPQNLRDGTALSLTRSGTTQTNAIADSGALVVKGIVFSENKPSAIINNQILSEGQLFNGVTIVKITKETVEFKADDKRWTQQVQR
jgi:hypothetical protein